MDLYQEDIRVWDAISDTEKKVAELDPELEAIIGEGKALVALKRNKGWKVLEKFIQICVDVYKDKLAVEQDMKVLRRLQEAVKAYEAILRFVDARIQEAQSLEQQRTPQDEG